MDTEAAPDRGPGELSSSPSENLDRSIYLVLLRARIVVVERGLPFVGAKWVGRKGRKKEPGGPLVGNG